MSELGLALEGVFCAGCGQEMRFQTVRDPHEGFIAVVFCPDDEGGAHHKIELCKGPRCKKALFWTKTSDGKSKPVDVETGLHHYQACNDPAGVRAAQVYEQQRRAASAPYKRKNERGGYGFGGVSRSRRPR